MAKNKTKINVTEVYVSDSEDKKKETLEKLFLNIIKTSECNSNR